MKAVSDNIKTVGGEKMLKFLDHIPKELKVGPWSPVAHFVVFSFAGFVLITAQSAYLTMSNSSPVTNQNDLQLFRLFFGLYALGWNLMGCRLIFAFLTDAGFHILKPVASFLKFPALVGCTNEKDLSVFLHFNLSFGLVNLHLFNLPITAVEFLWTSTPLTFFDLWCGFFVALLYCLFYLNVLDPLGLHFYIIFSPRTALCALSFGLILAAYYGFFVFWNRYIIQ
eukprot:gene27065-35777_t